MVDWPSFRGKALWTLAAFILYSALFILFFPRVGAGAASFSTLPVLVASWYFGIAGGILSSFLAVILNTALFYAMGAPEPRLLQHAGSAGSAALLLTGVAAGYGRTLYHRYERQLVARKEAEASLYKSESHFRTLFEESPLGIAMVDEHLQIVQANPRLCKMFGYTAEAFKTMSIRDIALPDDVQGDIDLAQQLISGELPQVTMERQFRRADQTIFWASLTVSLIRDEQGQFQFFMGMVQDVDERKRAEEEARRRIRELKLLNHLIGAASSMSEPRDVLQTTCRELARAFDLPQADAALLDESGRSLEIVAQFTTRDGESSVGERIPIAGNAVTETVMRTRKPLVIEDAQRDPRLAPVHHLMRRFNVATIVVLPLLVDDEVVGTLGLDATERRSFSEDEVRLAATAASALGPVLERARLYEEKQMQARRLQAQEQLAALGQLSAGIAHDFNNILGVITIYMEMLKREPLSAAALQRVNVVHEQARRATKLVEQMLDFSRKAVLQRRELDLVPFLEEQAQRLARTLPGNIAVNFTYQPGTYHIKGDAARLEQVIRNLAQNAREAMPHGGWIRLALSRLSPKERLPLPDMPPGDWIRIAFSDGGGGIAPRHLEHIFEPFFTAKSPAEHSGLGLAQVYGIVKQHGGFIHVETAVDEGTMFAIYLPAVT